MNLEDFSVGSKQSLHEVTGVSEFSELKSHNYIMFLRKQ